MKKNHRFLAILTALCLLGTLVPASVLATEGQMPGHLDDCSYRCNHIHGEDCGYVEAVEGRDCTHVHEHDDACGYAEGRDAVSCPNGEDCTGEEDGHVEPQAAVPGSACNYTHEHDESCGYAEAVEGVPCNHQCGEDEWVCAEGCPVAAGQNGIMVLTAENPVDDLIARIDEIAAIGIDDLTLADHKTMVRSAQTAYMRLSSKQQAAISKDKKEALDAAGAKIDYLDAVDQLTKLAAIEVGTLVYDDHTMVERARGAYSKLKDDYKAMISDTLVSALVAAEEKIAFEDVKRRLQIIGDHGPENYALEDNLWDVGKTRMCFDELTPDYQEKMPAELMDYLLGAEEHLDTLRFVNNYATLNGVRYRTVLAAGQAAVDGDTVVITGRVNWGGDITDGWPEGGITITGADGNASVILNGAKTKKDCNDGHDNSPNVTHLGCGVTFKAVGIEQSNGMNYVFANGYPLNVCDDVVFIKNGSQATGGETAGPEIMAVGGSDLNPVERTEMTLNAGKYSDIIGGGFGQDVTGDVKLTVGSASSTCNVVGGGYRSDVGGSVDVSVTTSVWDVCGGGYQGHVAKDTKVSFDNGETRGFVIGGSRGGGYVGGSTEVVIGADAVVGTFSGSVRGGDSNSTEALLTSNAYDKEAHMIPAARPIPAGDTYIGADTHVMVYGTVKKGVYGGGNAPVNGSTYVEINGTVYGELNTEGVFGGGCSNGADILGDTHVTINEGASIPMVKSTWNGRPTLLGGAVFGGGRFNAAVRGDTYVTLNGRVGTEELGGLVFGGGYGSEYSVDGTAYITVNAAPYAYTSAEKNGWQQYVTYDFIQCLSGVYGGGFNSNNNKQNAVITINTDMGDTAVYGDGLCGAAVKGSTTVIVKEAGAVNTVWGWYDEEGDTRSLEGTATVLFDGNTSSAKQILNADLVRVTNGSDVTIDNEGKDNEQLVNVSGLTIDKGGKLHLLADAHILGNYAGDTAEDKGALVISAGKTLTADGAVTGQTDVSIVDTDAVKAAEAQVYVVSGAGSTTESGDYSWIDRRTGLAMEWKANEDATSQWWLVKHDEPVTPPDEPTPTPTYYTVTVNYLNADGGAKLADSYTVRRSEGSRYDVSAEAAKAISGYAIDRVEGETSGALRGNVTVDVYYAAETTIVDPVTPIGPTPPVTEPETPDVTIDEGDVPTGALPELPVTPAEPENPGETVIVEEEIPLGNLPQTGTVAAEANPTLTLGAVALALSLALAGVTVLVSRKKEDAE